MTKIRVNFENSKVVNGKLFITLLKATPKLNTSYYKIILSMIIILYIPK